MKFPLFPPRPNLSDLPDLTGLSNSPDGPASEMLKAFRNAQAVDATAIGQTIERALASAGIDTQGGAMKAMQETIQRALAGMPAAGQGAGAAWQADATASADQVIDVEAREVGAPPRPARPSPTSPSPQAPPTHGPVQPGEFGTRSFSNAAGQRRYKLYVPKARGDAHATMPLVVMLHGCTQSPDDFAAGTRMNALAEQHGFLVAYPEQAPKANGSKCWNWFKAQDQLRDRGEPSLIAGITREVVAGYPVDPKRVFVAGLSAGAAMAVILGETYPELFAAIGVHSGLPYRAAHDVPSAFAAMKGGTAAGALPGAPPRPAAPLRHAVPTIVFHGDQDTTVGISNGDAVLQQARAALSQQSPAEALQPSEHPGQATGGRSYQRTVYPDAQGRPLIESWRLNGGGHAWSGGSASGSYTDATGPDASAEMLRFFLAQRASGEA